ncbi:hypothetical protein KW786_01935 [Candidatus Parcubacteria bacterium]|nr:hypothetical protein [Candidatus Parcubacteria bacterium]
MFEFLLETRRLTERKVRLFASAWLRIIGSGCADKTTLAAFFHSTESWAEGEIKEEEFNEQTYSFDPPADFPEPYRNLLDRLDSYAGDLEAGLEERIATGTDMTSQPAAVIVALPVLMREMFGNPFVLASFNPDWGTPTVVSLIDAAYQNRNILTGYFDQARLAILADALEEAGCTEAGLLAHLRQGGPHMLGCWAMDVLSAYEC